LLKGTFSSSLLNGEQKRGILQGSEKQNTTAAKEAQQNIGFISGDIVALWLVVLEFRSKVVQRGGGLNFFTLPGIFER